MSSRTGAVGSSGAAAAAASGDGTCRRLLCRRTQLDGFAACCGLEQRFGPDYIVQSLVQGDDLRFPTEHGITEYLVLREQRLRLGNCEAHHVAFRDAAELGD